MITIGVEVKCLLSHTIVDANRRYLGRIYQEHLGSIRHHNRQSSCNRFIWNRNLDTIQKFYNRPKLVIKPVEGELQKLANQMMGRFGWDIKNDGRSRMYDIFIGLRIGKVGYSTLLLTKRSLDPTHNILIEYELTNILDPPVFKSHITIHRFEEPSPETTVRNLQLKWNEEYEIEFEYSYEGSGKKVSKFKLELGSKDNVLLRLTKA